MKYIISTILMVAFICPELISQKPKSKEKSNKSQKKLDSFQSIGMFVNVAFQKKDTALHNDLRYKTIAVPSFFYQKTRNKNTFQLDYLPILYQEIDFYDSRIIDGTLHISSYTSKYRLFFTTVGLINKYQFYQTKKSNVKMVLENRLYYKFRSFIPHASNNFPKTFTDIGWIFSGGLEYEYRINNNVSINFLPTLQIFDNYFNFTRNKNPSFSLRVQKANDFISKLELKTINVKVGVSITI